MVFNIQILDVYMLQNVWEFYISIRLKREIITVPYFYVRDYIQIHGKGAYRFRWVVLGRQSYECNSCQVLSVNYGSRLGQIQC